MKFHILQAAPQATNVQFVPAQRGCGATNHTCISGHSQEVQIKFKPMSKYPKGYARDTLSSENGGSSVY